MLCALLAQGMALGIALPLADVLCFVWLHYELPDECHESYWLCY